MSYDIMNDQALDTTVLHLSHPITGLMYAKDENGNDDESKPVEITLYGRSSKTHRQWLALALRKQEANKHKKEKPKSPEEMLEENAEFFATMTASITNMNMGGEEVNSKEMYKKLYGNAKLDWITLQASEKIGSVDSFLQK